ncbi:MAG TPA: DUF2069 domain-containing protein [Gammaproteobacteria bacterium]|nr:DUF2069 domain-containing protein [Gammaproteobacteria bacterium]
MAGAWPALPSPCSTNDTRALRKTCPLMPAPRLLYALTLTGYFGTFALLLAWYAWLAPSTHLPVALVLLVLVTPLLFPLRGLLHARRYTIAWSCFLALLYFTHGVIEAWHSAGTRPLGLLEIVLTTAWFVGGIAYIKTGKQK